MQVIFQSFAVEGRRPLLVAEVESAKDSFSAIGHELAFLRETEPVDDGVSRDGAVGVNYHGVAFHVDHLESVRLTAVDGRTSVANNGQ